MSKTFEVEVAGPNNASLYFAPLQRRLRGRFDLRDMKEPEAGKLSHQWPDPIPGVRVGIDIEAAAGFVRDPLHDPDQAANRARIAQAGYALPPAREDFQQIDKATWVFWLALAQKAGLVRLTQGELPAVQGKPQTLFVIPAQEDPRDKTLKSLVALLYAKLTPKEREAYDQILSTLE